MIETKSNYLRNYFFVFSIFFCSCSEDNLFVTQPCKDGTVREGSVCVGNSQELSFNCVDVDLNKVEKGEMFTRCDGSLGEGRLQISTPLQNCLKENDQDCITTSSYTVVNSSKLDASKIAKGVTIAGVTGTLLASRQCRNYTYYTGFDSTYPPSNLGSGWTSFAPAAVNIATDQIDVGTQHGLLTNSMVRFTSSGTMPSPLVANTIYYAIYVSNTAIQLASVPNGSFIDISTQGTGTHMANDAPNATADYFDTLDDRNAGQVFSPPNNPWSTSDFLCDASNFVNVTSSAAPWLPSGLTPSTGNNAFTQIWQDQITNNYISNILYDGVPNNRNWSDAIRTCESLNGGTAGEGWRLPSQKELMQLYIHGISKVPLTGGSTNNVFWSSSIASGTSQSAWHGNLATGHYTSFIRTTASDSVLCIR